jgi:predicted phosphodiesterase
MKTFSLSEAARTLVLSDTHILMPGPSVAPIQAFIAEHKPDVLVFAGDTLDFFYARMAKKGEKVDAGEGVRFMEFIAKWLAEKDSRRIVALDGNHDPHWDVTKWLKRAPALAPLAEPWEGLKAYIEKGRLNFAETARLGDTLITHSHKGFLGDFLWRVAEPFNHMVGGMKAPHKKGRPFLAFRNVLIFGTGFYPRMALLGKMKRVRRVVYGHLHAPRTFRRWGMEFYGLPSWRPDETHALGGGFLYDPATQSWQTCRTA